MNNNNNNNNNVFEIIDGVRFTNFMEELESDLKYFKYDETDVNQFFEEQLDNRDLDSLWAIGEDMQLRSLRRLLAEVETRPWVLHRVVYRDDFSNVVFAAINNPNFDWRVHEGAVMTYALNNPDVRVWEVLVKNSTERSKREIRSFIGRLEGVVKEDKNNRFPALSALEMCVLECVMETHYQWVGHIIPNIPADLF